MPVAAAIPTRSAAVALRSASAEAGSRHSSRIGRRRRLVRTRRNLAAGSALDPNARVLEYALALDKPRSVPEVKAHGPLPLGAAPGAAEVPTGQTVAVKP